MAKLRVGKKKQSTTKEGVIVSSDFKRVQKFPSFTQINWSMLRSRRAIVTLVLLVAIVSLLIAYIVWRIDESNKSVVTKIQSESDYINGKLNSLKSSSINDDASDAEKVAYYDKLQSYSEQAGDYRAALNAFLKRADIRQSDLDYMAYATAARYYVKLGDKQGANTAIDKAISLLPPTANESSGYDPTATKNELLKVKQ